MGDALEVLRQIPDDVVQCCVTSPPYWGLRDYGIDGQLGLEKTPEEYVAKMVEILGEVRRVLRPDGVLWLNLGDSYASGKGSCYNPGGGETSWKTYRERKTAGVPPLDRGNVSTLRQCGLKPKDLIGIPWRVAFALQADGYWLRQDIIFHKPNPMPESVTDRCTKAHEYVFMLTKSARYYFDREAVAEPASNAGKPIKMPDGMATYSGAHGSIHKEGRERGRPNASVQQPTRNRRSVWTIPVEPYREAHFAVFPTALVEPCILAGSRPGDIVLDPFGGSGTTAFVARKHGRRFVHIDLKYHELAERRLAQQELLAAGAT